MRALNIIKFAAIPLFLATIVATILMRDVSDTAGIALIVATVVSGLAIIIPCEIRCFIVCTGGDFSKNGIKVYDTYNLQFGMIKALTGNLFKPREKNGEEIDDAGMFRRCWLDATLKIFIEAFTSVVILISVL